MRDRGHGWTAPAIAFYIDLSDGLPVTGWA